MRFPKLGIIKRREPCADLFLPELFRDVAIGVCDGSDVRMPQLSGNHLDRDALSNEVTCVGVPQPMKHEF